MPPVERIDMTEVEEVKVVQFRDHQLFDERVVHEAAEQIAVQLPNDGSPINLVLNFSGVGLISSTLLSKLVLLQRRVDASRGEMRLCELSPVLEQVFRTSRLDRLFGIDRDLRTALDHFRS